MLFGLDGNIIGAEKPKKQNSMPLYSLVQRFFGIRKLKCWVRGPFSKVPSKAEALPNPITGRL